MDLYKKEVPDTYSSVGGEGMSAWLDIDKWSWWFKYAALYIVAVYAFLIVYQILSPKETKIEKLKNMIDRDEKWAEVQSAYDAHPKKVEPEKTVESEKKVEPNNLAKMATRPLDLLADINEHRIQLLTYIWEWSRDTISDFIARRSVRIGK